MHTKKLNIKKGKQMDSSMQDTTDNVKKGTVRVELHTYNFTKSDENKK